MRVGVQHPGAGRAGEQETVVQHPARSRCSWVPSVMIFDSGMPSIHSVTITSPAAPPRSGPDVGIAGERGGEDLLRLASSL